MPPLALAGAHIGSELTVAGLTAMEFLSPDVYAAVSQATLDSVLATSSVNAALSTTKFIGLGLGVTGESAKAGIASAALVGVIGTAVVAGYALSKPSVEPNEVQAGLNTDEMNVSPAPLASSPPVPTVMPELTGQSLEEDVGDDTSPLEDLGDEGVLIFEPVPFTSESEGTHPQDGELPPPSEENGQIQTVINGTSTQPESEKPTLEPTQPPELPTPTPEPPNDTPESLKPEESPVEPDEPAASETEGPQATAPWNPGYFVTKEGSTLHEDFAAVTFMLHPSPNSTDETLRFWVSVNQQDWGNFVIDGACTTL